MTLDAVLDDVTTEVSDRTAGTVDRHPWMVPLIRLGWVAKAVVYGLMGWLTLLVAFDRPTSTDVSYTSAIEELANRPASRLTLALLAIGLLLYVAWRVLTILLLDGHDLNEWAHRIGYGFSAATYLVIAWLAMAVAVDRADAESGSAIEGLSMRLMGDGLGRTLLIIGGLGGIGVGGYFLYKGITRRFECELDLDGVSRLERSALLLSGAIGWFGRSLLVWVVSGYVTWAAITGDPLDARGFNRSVRHLGQATVGSALIGAIGVALVVYALYCAASARHRRLEIDP